MRLMAAVLATLVLATAIPAGLAAAGEGGPKLYLRGAIGGATLKPAELNDLIAAAQADSFAIVHGLTYKEFKATPVIGGEVGLRFPSRISTGLAVDFRTCGLTNAGVSSALPGVFVMDKMELSLTTVTANVAYELPAYRRIPSVQVGVEGGLGFGQFRETLVYTDRSDPLNAYDITGTFKSTGFVAGLFAGYDHPLGDLLVTARAGYRLQNMGKMDGTSKGTISGVPFSFAVTDVYDIDFKMSGAYATLGVGFAFGGR